MIGMPEKIRVVLQQVAQSFLTATIWNLTSRLNTGVLIAIAITSILVLLYLA
jgi:hypothetical protein